MDIIMVLQPSAEWYYTECKHSIHSPPGPYAFIDDVEHKITKDRTNTKLGTKFLRGFY